MNFNLADAVSILERTPLTLRAMLSGLAPKWTNANEGPETFSPFDVLGHLVHGERADWIPRAEIILAQGADLRFTPYDRFAQNEESKGKTLAHLLDEFDQLRKENLAKVRAWNPTDAQLSLEGEHPKFGAVTLRQLLATWAAHDLSHIGQVARVLAKQYRDAIGPWREYMPIMDR